MPEAKHVGTLNSDPNWLCVCMSQADLRAVDAASEGVGLRYRKRHTADVHEGCANVPPIGVVKLGVFNIAPIFASIVEPKGTPNYVSRAKSAKILTADCRQLYPVNYSYNSCAPNLLFSSTTSTRS